MRAVRFRVALCVASIGFVLMSYFGVGSAVGWVLRKEANDIGLAWAHHIEWRIPALPSNQILNGKIDLRNEAKREEIVEFVSTILSAGTTYQIDLIGSACNCAFSMGSFFDSRGIEDLYHGDHESGGVVHPPAAFKAEDLEAYYRYGDIFGLPWEQPEMPSHGFLSHASPSEGLSVDPETGQLALNPAYLHYVNETQAHSIHIIRDDSGLQPANYGLVYHSVIVDGQVDYVIRVLVDLEETANRYYKFLYTVVSIIVLLMLAAFLYPARLLFYSTKRQKDADERVRILAHHDGLTGTYNRNAFLEFGEGLLKQSKAIDELVHMYIFDVNQFKEVNDVFGHQSGDDLLIHFAAQLKAYAGENGSVYRLGGDEFAVIVTGITNEQDQNDALVEMPLTFQVGIDGGRRTIEASVCGGKVVYPVDAATLQDLLKCADLALYEAKSEGGGRLVPYREDIGASFRAEIRLREEFGKALDAGEIEPFYQPIINMRTGEMDGLEALARWNHPQRGILSPWYFSDMLADHEMASRVTNAMLTKVLADITHWRETGVDFVRVAINLSDGDLSQPNFASNLLDRLDEAKLPYKLLKFEVTENCIFGRNKDQLIHQLVVLREAGCHVALDDFGTGHSSITRIKDLPITALKIDKSFVNDVIEDDKDQAIIKALIGLGKDLSFRIVVEGVETQKQRDFLLSLGCEFAQGYLYCKAIEAGAIEEIIAERNGTLTELWGKAAI